MLCVQAPGAWTAHRLSHQEQFSQNLSPSLFTLGGGDGRSSAHLTIIVRTTRDHVGKCSLCARFLELLTLTFELTSAPVVWVGLLTVRKGN